MQSTRTAAPFVFIESEIFMCPVTKRRVAGLLTAAEKHLIRLGRRELERRKPGGFVRPIAEWLFLALPTGTREIGLARLDVRRQG